MEQVKNVSCFHLYLNATVSQTDEMLHTMLVTDSQDFILVPDPNSEEYFLGYMLAKHYNPLLEKWYSVTESKTQGPYQILVIMRGSIRSYLNFLGRRVFPPPKQTSTVFNNETPLQAQPNLPAQDNDIPFTDIWDELPATSKSTDVQEDPFTEFLKNTTPVQMEQALNEKVIGQPSLTKAVADFLYYHALRQLHPSLPQRPLLIAGPSGSGKTEVWRVASKLYGHLFPIKIIDGSSISCEGWAGNYKIDTYLNPAFADGGILVVDEFDKLAKPKHTSAGENVSLDVQAEFLKLVEGEYHITDKKKQTNKTTKMMGFVMVGAFEQLWLQKEQPEEVTHIGFCTAPTAVKKEATPVVLTDEDFIAYGILPELVGRIAVKCATKPLSDEAYMEIIRGPHSRVAAITKVLVQYGTKLTDVISTEELRQMVATSKSNRTGVRWVSAQVENRLLEAIREQGIFPDRAA